jgi:HTH-type transcriptional regulator, sugar sensing transcriptional regulator
MSEKVLKHLTDVGLSEKEALIYLSTLECGTSLVSVIASSANFNRITTYTILEKLLTRGLVTTSIRDGVKHFTAVSPEIFSESIKQRAKRLEKSVPHLLALAGDNNARPIVQMFEGLTGVKRAYKETFKSSGEILNFANSKGLREHWLEYDTEYVAERARKKIFLRGIAPDDKTGKLVKNDDEKFHRETRLLPQRKFGVENEINIFDDKMLITSFEPTVFAILIQSQAVADTQRQIFEMMWKFCEK